ncbi:MAG: hypothetical protein M0P70_08245 [Desulfobulbaceae bacterium]|nr:hypothetical protein [Desulfobulbaceae bacterium]
MKKTVIGLCLVCLTGCSAATEMSSRVNAEIDSYLAEREKRDYVQVVYPAELRRYQGNRQDTSSPAYWQNSSDEYDDYQSKQ